MECEGKRLLVLGSTNNICTIVKKAKEMRIHTIVTDNRPYENAPAKHISDDYENIDFSDVNRICDLITSERIDGVITGFTDSYLPYYVDICKKAELPCYCDTKQLAIATDKSEFKNACMKSGVPVIPGIDTDSFSDVELFSRENGYPIIIKPTDNSGSRGVIKCDNESDLKRSFEYALSFSTEKKVMVEKYMDCDNMAVSYFAANGHICLSTTDDRYVYHDDETGSSVSSYSIYPSKYTQRFLDELNARVVSMLKDNGFENGMISLQAFVDDKSFYFCEMCFRPSGGQHYLITKDRSGIDQMGLLIEFAVNGDCMDDWDYESESPLMPVRYIMLRILGIPGKKIHKIEGFERLKKYDHVINSFQACSEGQIIGKAGTTAQVLGDILFKISEKSDIKEEADKLLKDLEILDETGNSLAFVALN